MTQQARRCLNGIGFATLLGSQEEFLPSSFLLWISVQYSASRTFQLVHRHHAPRTRGHPIRTLGQVVRAFGLPAKRIGRSRIAAAPYLT